MTDALLRRDRSPSSGLNESQVAARRFPRTALGVIALVALGACKTEPTVPVEPLFAEAFPGTNGRSCTSCHVPEDGFALTPDHVVRLFETNPDDPLFAAIDADDPEAATLTFDHLKKGLVRVWLTLPENMDQIDEAGNVITPADRKIFVWRSVPSVADSALTAPYQLDGRVATLEEQAKGAITGHSEGGAVSHADLTRIADFERSTFSNDRARQVADELAAGVAFEDVDEVEDSLDLTAQEARGKDLYDKVCATCHGGANTATIVDREIHDLGFYALKPDGSGYVQYAVPATDPPTPVLASQPDNEFLNIGVSIEMYLATLGAKEEDYLTKDLEFPYYRFRFYADGSREAVVADLPPAGPALDPGGPGGPDGPFGPGDELDEDGNPIVGPNGGFQPHSVDPGRAAITGNPLDFESFDVPSLRGLSKTAPYFHNNIVSTLDEVVQLYSDHLLARWPSLVQPGEKEPDDDGDAGPPEAFTATQKEDIVAFLKRL